jgi:hypothetical protein
MTMNATHLRPVLGLLAIGWLSACTQGRSPGLKRHQFDAFSISVPATWTVKTWTSSSTPNGPTPTGQPMVSDVHFDGPDGEYLAVHDEDFDVSGDHEADSRWTLVPRPDGTLEVTAVGDLCLKGPDWTPGHPCTAGDGRLDALAHLAFGHGFEFKFGNTRRERAEDLKPFKAILGTFKAGRGP